jgi:hypothetical protein
VAGDGNVLARRALNRAFLARQLLLERAPMPALDAIEHLLGMQAQAPLAPYVGLWARLRDFDPAELAALIEARRAVRIAAMRSTIHLLSADDCLVLRPLVQIALDRSLGSNWKGADGIDRAELAAAGRAAMADGPLTFAELGPALAGRFPGRDPQALAMAARAFLALVQVPPRGIWGRGGVARHAPAEQWLGRELDDAPDLDAIVRRYLAAYGPATVADFQAWSGVTRTRESFDRLRPGLASFRDEHGRELFDLPDAPRPDPSTPAPVRLIPEYDNLLLSHADRRRAIAEEHRELVFTRGAVLVDGFACANWKLERAGARHATLQVGLFRELSKRETAAVRAEGNRLLEFAASGAVAREVRFAPPTPPVA